MLKPFVKTVRAAPAVLVLTMGLCAAQAQSASNTSGERVIDEIIITAAKREQSLQDVSMSVAVTSGQTIERTHIMDLNDLQFVVPSLRVTQSQATAATTFIIRGFGNGANNPGIEPSVGVYIDGVYRSRSVAALADLPIVERVEVLRGPQSTLFGKNASAGVISITTRLPENNFGGKLEADIGNYGTQIFRATLTGPLSAATSFRLTANKNESDGYYKNITNGARLNGRDRWAVRGQLLTHLSDTARLRVIADYNEIEEICCGVSMLRSGPATLVANGLAQARGLAVLAGDVSPYARRTALGQNPTNALEGKGLSADLDMGLDGMAFRSITAYREQSSNAATDSDFNAADLIARNSIDDDFETFTQEFRLTSTDDGAVQWMAGVYYFDESVRHFRDLLYGRDVGVYVDTLVQGATGCATGAATCTNLDGLALLLAGGNPAGAAALRGSWYQPGQGLVGETFTMDNEALSLFGQVDWQLGADWLATLGLNYTEDKKTVTTNVDIDDPFAGLPLAANPLTAPLAALQFFPPFVDYPNANESGVFESDDLTHAAQLTYALDADTNFYVSHSTGFKAASVNLSVDARVLRSAAPEEATNIEIGVKRLFSNGFVNAALFEQEIDGFQSNLFTGTGFALINAGRQVHRGVEVDALWQASENLTLTFSGTYLEPEFETHNAVASLVGAPVAGVHEVSAHVAGNYAFRLGALDAYARADFLHESDVQVIDNVPSAIAAREVNVLNASFGVSHDAGAEVMLWGRNLTGDDYLITAFPTTVATGSYSGYVAAPRTYGVTLRYHF